jgi:5-methylcytosine-specific restriction endonuclease McrA
MWLVTESWPKDNPSFQEDLLKLRVKNHNKRAASYGVPGVLTVDDWRYVFEQAERQCQQCGTEKFLTLDHILSFWEGGTNLRENLQILCATCHQQKSNEENRRRMRGHWARKKSQKGQ